ncbi:hypothetical protein Hte_000846 [Hypoxylon texense]
MSPTTSKKSSHVNGIGKAVAADMEHFRMKSHIKIIKAANSAPNKSGEELSETGPGKDETLQANRRHKLRSQRSKSSREAKSKLLGYFEDDNDAQDEEQEEDSVSLSFTDEESSDYVTSYDKEKDDIDNSDEDNTDPFYPGNEGWEYVYGDGEKTENAILDSIVSYRRDKSTHPSA